MKERDPVAIISALCDPSRLRILKALQDGPQYGEVLSHRVGIAPSTVSFHLKKLEAVGLVSRSRDQYYAVYAANNGILDLTLRDLLMGPGDDRRAEEQGINNYRVKVLKTFFREGRLLRLPVQKKKRRMVLEEFAALFEAGRAYSEQQTNEIIGDIYDDYCAIRRELVDGALLARKGQVYRLVGGADKDGLPVRGAIFEKGGQKGNKGKEKSVDRKTELKRSYRENPPPAGVYRITNKANGKVFVGTGMNAQGKLNGQRAQLRWGSHRNGALQADWKEFGEDNFVFEVLDYLEPSPDPGRDLREELTALEELWLNKLQPYGDRGYNKMAAKK